MSDRDQYMSALEKANATRLKRAEVKRAIRRGEAVPESVIEEMAWYSPGWPIGDLLRAQRYWGVKLTRRFLQSRGIGEQRLLGELTDRQRKLLVEALRARRLERS